MNSHRERTFKEQLKIFVSGRHLPRISAILLKDGQQYYLITVGSNLLAVIMFYLSALPVGYRTIFAISNIFLTNAMACRIYRNAKLKLSNSTNVMILSTIHGEPSTRTGGIALSLPRQSHQAHESSNAVSEQTVVSAIQISKAVEIEDDSSNYKV